MSTKIEWCEETWNPIIGCSQVSPGCNNCYAERMAGRIANMDNENYQRVVKVIRSLSPNPKPSNKVDFAGIWNGRTHLVGSVLDKPLHWKKPRTIFVCSMGDLFHESVQLTWINFVWMRMSVAKQHTFLILTKRPERMSQCLSAMDWGILPNVWLGVTAENQEQADKRIPILLKIPATKRFVSIEPMLGPVDLEDIKYDDIGGETHISALHCDVSIEDDEQFHGKTLDWVIVGGETGPGARPMHPDWVRSLRHQSRFEGVPFFFKSWGDWGQGSGSGGEVSAISNTGEFVKYHDPDEWEIFTRKYGEKWHEINPTLMSKCGKKKAGHLLDGKEWRERP